MQWQSRRECAPPKIISKVHLSQELRTLWDRGVARARPSPPKFWQIKPSLNQEGGGGRLFAHITTRPPRFSDFPPSLLVERPTYNLFGNRFLQLE